MSTRIGESGSAAPCSDPAVSTVEQPLSGKVKKVSPFRDRETRSQPCLSIVSSIISLVPGGSEQAAQQDTTRNDRMHVPKYRIVQSPDIRLEAANLLTAIIEHDQYLDDVDRSHIQLAMDTLDIARAKQEMAEANGSGP